MVDAEDAPYRGLIRNVTDVREAPERATFLAGGRKLEIALYEPVPKETLERLVDELRVVLHA